MKVQVTVESFRCLIETVNVFSTEEKAAEHIRGCLQENGLLTQPDDAEKISTIPGLVEWLGDEYNPDKYDIRWFETEIDER